MRSLTQVLFAAVLTAFLAGCQKEAPKQEEAAKSAPPPAKNCLSFSQCGTGGPCDAAWPSELDGSKIRPLEASGPANGVVIARCKVSTEGEAKDCKVTRPVPNAEAPALAALEKWRGHAAWFCTKGADGTMTPSEPVELEQTFVVRVRSNSGPTTPPSRKPAPAPAPSGTH
jgi:hypothetical protein